MRNSKKHKLILDKIQYAIYDVITEPGVAASWLKYGACLGGVYEKTIVDCLAASNGDMCEALAQVVKVMLNLGEKRKTAENAMLLYFLWNLFTSVGAEIDTEHKHFDWELGHPGDLRPYAGDIHSWSLVYYANITMFVGDCFVWQI